MSEPVLDFVQCPDAQGTHRMAYWSWGNPAASHVVFCVHGLTRQGRDFDVLAQALVASARLPTSQTSGLFAPMWWAEVKVTG
jgi:hypothetical protein